MAFIVPEFKLKEAKRVNDGISVYRGEMLARLAALQWVEKINPLKTIVCSGSSLFTLQDSNGEGEKTSP